MQIDAESWSAAVTDLFGAWTFAAVGPRTHEDWRRDLSTALILDTRDPRGWLNVNYAPICTGDSSAMTDPFHKWNSEDLDGSLFKITEKSATEILVALQGTMFKAKTIPDFSHRRERLFHSATTILARFGPTAHYYVNCSLAEDDPNLDLLNDANEFACLSKYIVDCGAVVVSETEVGAFWGFFDD
ncbi:hypothetical protein [Streptomyces yerevanensis]|uniref:hypothetical protein n=1 Tax=Streptomyces yerevanensis TaxID=66378 RepID=UPI0005261A39|nr:hypothetical protein [Streptomyces yerevanensis]